MSDLEYRGRSASCPPPSYGVISGSHGGVVSEMLLPVVWYEFNDVSELMYQSHGATSQKN
jgi:hypothetical protein